MPLAPQIDTIIGDAIARRIFPGAVVLVAHADRVLHVAAYGATVYDEPGATAVCLDTIYDIASLTKVFTAAAALRLYEMGVLDLHSSVAGYLPTFGSPSVTVWQLLTHTSGLDIRLSTLRHAGRPALLAAAYGAALMHPPGTRVAYTNVNSLLLGEIVARLHGASLDVAVRELVTDVLVLRDTHFRPRADLLTRIAPTEIDDEWRGGLVHGSVHDESAHALGGVAGHAGLFSTAHDLYVFCRSWLPPDEGRRAKDDSEHGTSHPPSPVRHRRLLAAETVTLATSNHTLGLNAACGLGWMLDRQNFMGPAPAGSFGHTGFTGPAIVVVPRHRLIVVVLSNRVYPLRGAPHHHQVTAAVMRAALAWTVAAPDV